MIITPSSEVRLLNVPFLIDYKDIMDFGSKTDQTNYFLGKTIANGNMGDDFSYVRQNGSIKVPIEIDLIRNCNYVMYKNDLYGSKWFYAFVSEMKYVNPNTTELVLVTDVWSTWQFDITFKESFIEREHRNRWNADGTPVVNTIDEGLSYGTEYDIVSIEQFQPSGGIFFLVIVTKKQLEGSQDYNPTLNGVMSPLSYYVFPFKQDGTMPPTSIGGTTASANNFKTLLQMLYFDESSADNVVSLYVTDYLGENISYDGTVHLNGNVFSEVKFGTAQTPIIKVDDNQGYETTSKDFGDKYDDYNSVTESKLLMYPYTVLQLTDGKGNVVTLKNEYIHDPNLTVIARGSIGTSNKVAYYIRGYLQDPNLTNGHINNLQYAVINNDPNDVPIVHDLLSAYLQGHKNSINNAKAQTIFNQNLDVANSVASLPRSVMGGIPSVLHNAIGGVQTYGNHQFNLLSIMAKQQDIANTPPSISGLGANVSFDFGNSINGVYVIKKQITNEYRRQLGDYFKMFGYKAHLTKVPTFDSRQHFNYIKTVGVTIVGNIPQPDLQIVKDIFNNGVTVWHVDDVGNYDLTNDEVSL
jgi:tail knob protein gp9/major tail-like protein